MSATVVISTTTRTTRWLTFCRSTLTDTYQETLFPPQKCKITRQAIITTMYCHPKHFASSCPCFFGQPKIQNPDVPLCPIMASRGLPTSTMARHITKILHPQLIVFYTFFNLLVAFKKEICCVSWVTFLDRYISVVFTKYVWLIIYLFTCTYTFNV